MVQDKASDPKTTAEERPPAPSIANGNAVQSRNRSKLLWFKHLGEAAEPFAAIAYFLTAIAAILSIVFLIAPRLKPAEATPPPSTLGATLSKVALEERVAPAAGPAYFVVSYDVEFAGYKGKQSPVQWAAFDARTLQRLPLEAPPPSKEWTNPIAVRADAPNDRENVQIRILVPRERHCIFVRIYVYDEHGTRLDYADTPPFDTHDPTNRSCASLNGQATPAV